LCGPEEQTTDWCWKNVENVPGCDSYEDTRDLKTVEVSWLRGVESVMSECGKFEFNATPHNMHLKSLAAQMSYGHPDYYSQFQSQVK